MGVIASQDLNILIATTVYENNGIKRNEIKGVFYRNLRSKHSSFFTGYIIPENNEFDKDVIAIYLKSEKHVGYLPKGSGKVKDKLIIRKNKMMFIWGKINHNPETNNFWAHVYTPFDFKD